MHTRNTGKQKLPPDGDQMMTRQADAGPHDVLTLCERPYLAHGESSFKYPQVSKDPEPESDPYGTGTCD
jgi:hypothetical protein